MASTTFAQLVVASQRLSELVTDEMLAKLIPDDAAEVAKCRQTIADFTNADLLPNDEAATIGALFAKLAAFRAAKDQDGQQVRSLEADKEDITRALELAQERLRLAVEVPDTLSP